MTKAILSAATIVELDPGKISVPAHHRMIDEDYAAAMAEDIGRREQEQPITVVATGDDAYELVFGAHRCRACELAGKSVKAIVRSRKEAASDADRRMSTIAENFFRRPNTVLERARDIGAWRAIHEAAHGKAKRGRKKAAADLEELSADFALNFTEAAQRALDMSRRSVFLALKIAALPDAIADLIAAHRVANKQGELLALADLDSKQQSAVAKRLAAGEADSVDAALAKIENRPPPPVSAPWERVSNAYAALKPAEQNQLFQFLKPAFERWLAEKG